jgi:hypothetical protein
VNCRDIDDRIMPYILGKPIPPEVAVHIAKCERCSRLAAALRRAPQVDELPRQQLKQIEDRILGNLRPVKPLPATGVLSLVLLSIFAIVVVIGNAILGTAGWHAVNVLQKFAVFSALTASAGLLAFSAVRQIIPGSRLGLPPRLLVSAVVALMAGIFTTLFVPHRESTFISTGLLCLEIGLACAIPTAALLWLVLRRGAMLSPISIGATAGALAGLSGLIVLEVFCPNLNKYHILLWHMGAVLATIIGCLTIGLLAEYRGRKRIGPTP